MLAWLAATRIECWWRGCLGRKAYRDALHLVLLNKCALLVQANFRALKGRRRAAGKRRMKFDKAKAQAWRREQGLVMRLVLRLMQRRHQRTAYRVLGPLGLQPNLFNFSTRRNYGLRKEVPMDFILFKMTVEREKDLGSRAGE